ncbi:MAG: winged helix-turn-helix transcriptional regulator [Candidatus Nanohaloarchaea archaeon]
MRTREVVEQAVEQNPGISFTGLKEETGLANGVLQHHIRKSDKVVSKKGALLTDDVCGDCELSDHCMQTCIRRELRKPLVRKILEMLSRGQKQKDIAAELDRHSSTISYHVNRLEEIGAIDNGEPVEGLDL